MTTQTETPASRTDGSTDSARVLVSYFTLRKTVGLLGILLPIVLALGCVIVKSCEGLQDSISAYQGTAMRDVFAGTLFTVGFFLLAYRGYERQDDIAGDLACLCSVGVALCSVTSSLGTVRALHHVFAAVLFLVLAYFSLFLFTKTGGKLTEQKKQRNKVYVTCGVVILACIALIAAYNALGRPDGIAALKPVFWLESIALWAFGVSWMTKGEMLLSD